MKNSFSLITILVLCFLQVVAQEIDFTYNNGEKVPLFKVENKKYVLFSSSRDIIEMKNELNPVVDEILSYTDTYKYKAYNKNKLLEAKPWVVIAGEGLNQLESLEGDEVLYESHFYKMENGEEIGLSHLFYVKLNNEKDITELELMAETNHMKI